jgi:NADPH-dependent ferric siderophore reductase
MSIDASATPVQRVRHEIKQRALCVLRVASLGPNVKSITFGGDTLGDFISASFDDHVKFMVAGADGVPVRRDYTPRHVDTAARELTIEFALHGSGPVAAWAAQAAPGQEAAIAGPRGSFIIALDLDWHLLVGDASAMPAIARRLDELPAAARAIVVLHVHDERDRRILHSAAQVELQWVASGAALIAAVRALRLPPGAGFAWCAGEAGTSAALRQILVAEKGMDSHWVRAAAYWKQGAIAHHENLEDTKA